MLKICSEFQVCPEAFHKPVFSCFSLAGIARACHHAAQLLPTDFLVEKKF